MARKAQNKTNGFPDWASIHPGGDRWLPLRDDPDFRFAPQALVRLLFFRLDELPAALARRDTPRTPVWVHVDVLRIDTALSFDTPELILHARRIEVGAAAALALRSGDEAAPACRLVVRADEWAFEGPGRWLPVTIGGVRHELHAQPPGGGLDAALDADGTLSLLETSALRSGDPLSGQMALDAARRLARCPPPEATDESTGPQALAARMADWVARTGGQPLLRSDARAFAQRLHAPVRGRHPVPALKLAEYDDLARDTQAALAAVEEAWRDQLARGRDLEDQRAAAESMLGHYRHAKAYADRLLTQSAEEMAEAEAAVQQAQTLVAGLRGEATACQALFETGIKAKEAELRRQAVFEVIGAVIELGAGIAAIVATGGAAAPVAAPAAASAAAQSAKAADRIKKLIELLKKIQKVLKVIAKLAQCAVRIKGIHDALARPEQARQRAEAANATLPDPLAPDERMSAADWEVFEVGLDTLFAPAIELRIDGAEDFLLVLKRLAVRGRDLVATHALLDRCVHEHQQRLWQRLRDEADIADMQARIQAIVGQRGPGNVLMTYVGQLRDRLQFRLIHAIDRMRDAYRYETLTEPRWQPGVSLRSAELAAMLSDLQEALVRAKEKRQALGSWNDYLEEQDPALLDRLRQTGALSWVIDSSSFPDEDRVRIDEVRVWLRGDLGQARRRIDIATSGHYDDRRGAKTFGFDAPPLQRRFHYEPARRSGDEDHWGEPVRLLHRANDVEGDYFQPSAFTTWTIRVPLSGRGAPDLAGLREVAIEFFGTALPAAAPLRGGVRRGVSPLAAPRPLRKVLVL